MVFIRELYGTSDEIEKYREKSREQRAVIKYKG